MESLDQLSPSDIAKPDVVKSIEEKVNLIINEYDDKEALIFSRQLKRLLQRQDLNVDAKILNTLQRGYTLTSYLSLPAQSDDDINSLFQNNFREILFLDEWILFARLETKLWATPFGPREEFCKNLINSLRSNHQKIGDEIIGEWLATYAHSYPNMLILTDFEKNDFLKKNEKASNLSEAEKELLNKLLKIYNFLRPFELWAQDISDIIKGEGEGILAETEKKQVRLGQALEKTTASSQNSPRGYQGPQDLRDIRPKSPNVAFSKQISYQDIPVSSLPPLRPSSYSVPEQNKEMPLPPTTQEVKPPPGFSNRPIANTTSWEKKVSLTSNPQSAMPQVETEEHKQVDQSSDSILNKNFVQHAKVENKSVNVSDSKITISTLEAVAEKGDPVEEEKLRRIIHQDFNKLSLEVRNYIVNSPFWAE